MQVDMSNKSASASVSSGQPFRFFGYEVKDIKKLKPYYTSQEQNRFTYQRQSRLTDVSTSQTANMRQELTETEEITFGELLKCQNSLNETQALTSLPIIQQTPVITLEEFFQNLYQSQDSEVITLNDWFLRQKMQQFVTNIDIIKRVFLIYEFILQQGFVATLIAQIQGKGSQPSSIQQSTCYVIIVPEKDLLIISKELQLIQDNGQQLLQVAEQLLYNNNVQHKIDVKNIDYIRPGPKTGIESINKPEGILIQMKQCNQQMLLLINETPKKGHEVKILKTDLVYVIQDYINMKLGRQVFYPNVCCKIMEQVAKSNSEVDQSV